MNEVTTIERGETSVALTAANSDPVAFIAQLALNPQIDEQKLRVLWDIQKDVLAEKRKEQAEAARVAYVAARAQMQKELPIIGRDKENKHDRYHYATLENIWEHCLPVWTKYGFSVAFQSRSVENDLIRVSLQLYHEDGHVEEFFAPDTPPDNKGRGGTVNKTPIQANQSTVTYVKRGLLCSALGIVTRNEDDDGTSAGGQSEPRYEPRAQQRYSNSDTRSLTEQARAGEFNRPKSQQQPVQAQKQEPSLPSNGPDRWIAGIERRIEGAGDNPSKIDAIGKAATEAKTENDLTDMARSPVIKKLAEVPDNLARIQTFLAAARARIKKQSSPPDPAKRSTLPFIADIHDYESGDVLEGPFTDAVDWSVAYRDHLKSLSPEEAKASVSFHWKTIEDARTRDPEAKKRLIGLEAPKA